MQKLAAAREVLDKLPVDSIDIIYRNWHYQVKYCQDHKYFDPSIFKLYFIKTILKFLVFNMLSFYHSVVSLECVPLFTDRDRRASCRWWECYQRISVYQSLHSKYRWKMQDYHSMLAWWDTKRTPCTAIIIEAKCVGIGDSLNEMKNNVLFTSGCHG